MANEDTRPTGDNTGGAPTEAELIDYLRDVDRPVSLEKLAHATGETRERIKARISQLEQRGLVIVSMGLYHVTVRLGDGVATGQPIADGGGATHLAGDVDLTPEQVWMVLSNERRRETLSLLARQARRDGGVDDTYAPVSPLAAVVCASDEDFSTESNPAADDQHSTYVALTQTHLPLLHDLGIVEYHSRVQKVAPTEAVLVLAQLMDVVDDVAEEETAE